MDSTQIYEPIREYDSKYKRLHKDNVSEYFEDLVKAANINEEENIETIQKINKLESQIKVLSDSIGKYKVFKTITIVLIVVAFIAAFIIGINLFNNNEMVSFVADIFILIGVVGVAVGFIFLLTKKINVVLKQTEAEKKAKEQEKAEQLKIAWDQMQPLNDLYDWGMPAELVERTLPFITMDKYFNPKRYDVLHNKFKLADNSDPNESVIFVQSGEILGNPFALAKKAHHYMGTHTYTGSLTISWTEVVRNSDGSQSTVRRTQTLHASVVKPMPMYYNNSFLVYGNDAAPNLSFSRKPEKAEKLTEKQLQKKVKKGSKKLEKQASKAVVKGGSFTTMADEEFDVLFGAKDRNHEVQFRLLFTPLAQREMLKIIKDDKVGFGDDFEFIKSEKLNVIKPWHLEKADIVTNPLRYVSYELERSRTIFNSYNNAYFKSVFFAFAPIFAIPLYQQYKAKDYIYKDFYNSNVSCWEHEAIVNSFDQNKLKHINSVTYNILKTRLVNSTESADEVEVTALGYERFPETDYVRVRGGDGYYHNVPVHWYRYEPVQRTSNIVLKTADTLKRNDYIKQIITNTDWQEYLKNNLSEANEVVFRKNIIAYTAKEELGLADIDKLKKMFDR